MFPLIVVVGDVLSTHQMKHAPSQKCSLSVFEPPPSTIYEVEKHGGGVMLHELEMFGAAVAIAFVTRANTILQIIGFLRLSSVCSEISVAFERASRVRNCADDGQKCMSKYDELPT